LWDGGVRGAESAWVQECGVHSTEHGFWQVGRVARFIRVFAGSVCCRFARLIGYDWGMRQNRFASAGVLIIATEIVVSLLLDRYSRPPQPPSQKLLALREKYDGELLEYKKLEAELYDRYDIFIPEDPKIRAERDEAFSALGKLDDPDKTWREMRAEGN
jgi:hypothetical protein